jgi:hypothetical protein
LPFLFIPQSRVGIIAEKNANQRGPVPPCRPERSSFVKSLSGSFRLQVEVFNTSDEGIPRPGGIDRKRIARCRQSHLTSGRLAERRGVIAPADGHTGDAVPFDPPIVRIRGFRNEDSGNEVRDVCSTLAALAE